MATEGNSELDQYGNRPVAAGERKADGTEDSSESSDTDVSAKYMKYRMFKTVWLALIGFNVGAYNSIISPTLTDLTLLLLINYEDISQVLSAKFVGLLIGGFIGGFLSDKFVRHVDLFLSLASLILGVSTFCVPWSVNRFWLGLCFFLQGFCQGTLSTGGTSMVMVLWENNSHSPLQFTHLGFGIGAIVGAYIVRPFMTDHTEGVVGMNATNCSDAFQNFTANSNMTNICNDDIHWPYGILGVVSAVTAVPFLVFYLMETPEELDTSYNRRQTVWRLLSPSQLCGSRRQLTVPVIIVLFWLYLFFFRGREHSLTNFLDTIAKESELKFSKESALTLTTLYFVSDTIGKFLAVFVAKFVRPNIMFISLILLTALSLLSLSLLGFHYPAIFWVSALAVNFFTGPTGPSALAWLDAYIDVTALILAISESASGIGGLLFQNIAGRIYEKSGNRGPNNVVNLALGLSIADMVIVIVWYAVTFVMKSKNDNSDNPNQETTSLIRSKES